MVSSFILLMWRKGKYVPIGKLKPIYYAYVQSYIVYMLPIYSETNIGRTSKNLKSVHHVPSASSHFHFILVQLELAANRTASNRHRVCLLRKMVNSRTKRSFILQSNGEVHNWQTTNMSNLHFSSQHPADRVDFVRTGIFIIKICMNEQYRLQCK